MPELTMTVATAASVDLTGRVARMANRVATVLTDVSSPESGSQLAIEFLRRWADTAQEPMFDANHPIDRLCTRFDLTSEESDLILLAGLPEEHEGIATTFRSLHPVGEPRPTVGLAAVLMGGTVDDRSRLRHILATGAASRHGILDLAGTGTLFERSLILSDGVWESLHGHDAWPVGIQRLMVPTVPPGLDGWIDQPDVARAVRAIQAGDRVVVMLSCGDDLVALARCSAMASAAGRRLMAASVQPADRRRVASLAVHAAIRDAVPTVLVSSPLDGSDARLDLGDLPGTLLVCSPPGALRSAPDRPILPVPAGPVSVADQRTAWRAALPDLAEHAASLAARHGLDPAHTAQLGLDVRIRSDRLEMADVSSLIRARAAVNLPPGVELRSPAVPWSHLVLPDDSAWQLRDAVARLEHQAVVLDEWGLRVTAHASRGARLLFSGPPGTGKSLAAHAVASAAHTDLLVVDVSTVVSKWLGETEKNLAAAFDTAERTQAVLLLDEADALFATRTEVSDSHDRYANLETAYLLQRLDRFEGLAILTTNMRANIDSAFTRRMDFVVEFPLPDVAGRAQLWAQHLPAAMLADDVDFDDLARLYAVPGAWIRNAAVAAAFQAAGADGLVSQQHLVGAMRREYAKAALPFPGEPPRRRHDIV